MDAPPSQLADKPLPPPPRPPLITPSLSPPGSRVFQRIPDRPAPPKRPRLSSTPSSSASARLPSAPPRDLRLESSSRLFAFWDQLAARYNKPLDEDDIVDLRDLDFIKDRGVTRSAAKSYEIGSFATADADDASSQGAEDENETSAGEENVAGEDDSADELDLISPPPVEDVVQEKLRYYKNWNVPPADEQNPEDAEAFREFEEAEKRRKELYGDEEEEDEPDDDGAANTDGPVYEEEEEADEAGPSEQADPPISSARQDESDGRRSPSPPKRTPQRRKSKPPPHPAEDDSSEDELAAWEIDDTPVPPRHSVPPLDDIIDLTLSRSPSPVAPIRGRSQSRPRASVAPLRRSQSQPRARAQSKVRLQEPSAVRPRSASPAEVLQLLTPPRSSCSVPEQPPEMAVIPVRDGSPSPKMPRPRPRYLPKSRSPSESDQEDEQNGPEFAPLARDLLASSPPPKTPSKVSRASMKPEVVITVRRTGSVRGKTPIRAGSPEVPLSVSARTSRKAKQDGMGAPSGKAKGKGKETAPRPVTPEPPPKPSSSRRDHSQPPAVSDESCSPQPVPPKGRKRRRVSSSSSEGSPEKSSSSKPSPRKQPGRSSVRASGYSSDAPPPTSSPVRTDHEDDSASARSARSHHRARSEAPIPALPIYPPVYPLSHQRPDHQRASSVAHPPHPLQHAFPPMSPQQSQATMAYISYLMAAGAFLPPPPPSSGSGYYPAPSLPFYGMPHTPSHRARPPLQFRGSDTPSSSEAGPSRSSVYSTPTHYPHAYPYWFDPRYSNGSLPPSSPIPSSPINPSPVLRPASVPPGQRSQARGRRVSFKLDGNDRPLSASPPRHSSPSERDPEDVRMRDRSRRSNTPARPSKGKGKARAATPSDEGEDEDEDEDEDSADGKEDAEEAGPAATASRRRPPSRERTPGPPARRGAATSKEKAMSARKK